jgi:PKD repeat protein
LVVAPNPAIVGTNVTLDASGSTDANGRIAEYAWDLDGNGTYETDGGTSSRTTQTFQKPGLYTVGVEVANTVGKTATARLTITIDPRPTQPGDAGVVIDNDARYTNSLDVVLSIVAPPFADQIRVSNGGGVNGQLYTVPGQMFQMPWRLDASKGKETRIVYVRFYAGGRFLETQTDDIILDQTPPVVQSATVVPVSSASRAARHAAGYQLRVLAHDNRSGIAQIQIRIGHAASPFRRYSKTLLLHPSRRGVIMVRVKDGAGNLSRWKQAHIGR